ncbi:unnamed protein product [Cladocopium goreaui]|uniref:Liver carboxylesterase 2 n=1 Tax=Cladocopium goreaui TaxID=2562237 RepID=A0A9P1FS29_9DINO|nr:unnamed protein product [Cladocopium goreaui]
MAAVNVTSLEELRKVPAEKVQWPAYTMNDPAVAPYFSGYFEDPGFLPASADQLWAAGKVNPKSIMVGYASKDGTAAFYSVAPTMGYVVGDKNQTTAKDYEEAIRKVWGSNADAVLLQYPLSRFEGSPQKAFLQVDADSNVICPSYQLLQYAQAADIPSWAFQFAHFIPSKRSDGWGCSNGPELDVAPPRRGAYTKLFATHGDDVKFVFGNEVGPDGLGPPNNRTVCTFTPGERMLSEKIRARWASFAASGQPFAWPEYVGRAEVAPTLILSDAETDGLGIASQAGLHAADCSFWQRLWAQPSINFVPGEEERSAWELWAEALLLRILESLSEHGLHAPEFIAALYDSVRFAEAVNEVRLERGSEFIIKYDNVLSGVEAIRRNGDPFRGGINFDDVNELGLEGRIDEMSKTYREAPSVWVVLDLVSNFQPVFVFKVWIFLLAWYTSMSQDNRNGYLWFPTFKRANTLQYLVLGESIGSAVSRPGQMDGKEDVAWTRGKNMLLQFRVCGSTLGKSDMMHSDDLDMNAKKEDIEELTNGYGPDLQKAEVWASSTPFIDGRPKAQSVHWFIGAVEAIGCICSAAVAVSVCNEEPEPDPGQDNQDARRFAKEEAQILRDLAWLLMLSACFFFELKFIVPLIADFEFGAFCGDSCHLRQTKNFKLISSDCFACTGALAFCWSLVVLTAFFDVYYIFYAGTAIFGYCMGEWRGLRNVLSTALRHLDLDSSPTAHIPGVFSQTEKASRVMSDGEAMQAVFGVSWRMAWSRIVEALYEDHVISSDQANAMVKAASTVRWDDEKGMKTVALKGLTPDQFSRLRFTATQLRNGIPAKDASKFGALSRCISALEVYVRTPEGGHKRPEPWHATRVNHPCRMVTELVHVVSTENSASRRTDFHCRSCLFFKTDTGI